MIFNVKKIINFISQGTTLLPGDVIMTGTPEGTFMAQMKINQ
jgi:2-keto-4-pentenoate hydratase/2-oxohepta-3-ene-1,7-dioic acid hydratase in catechol pathway